MADSIKFTIGGKLGTSYKGALSQAVAEAKLANNSVQKEMAISSGIAVDMSKLGQFKQWRKEYLASMAEEARLQEALRTGGTRGVPGSTDAAYDAALIRQNGLIKVRVAQIAAERAAKVQNDVEVKAAFERLQIFKLEKAAETKAAAEAAAAQFAEMEAANLLVARGYGAKSSAAHGHGGGGLSGIIRESLVVVREISMGRGTGRVAGSVTLLAQYMGLLGKVVKSTAQEQILASDAASALSQKMAAEAAAAKGTLQYTQLLTAARKQEAIATEALTEKEIALQAAKVSVNPLGWAIIAGVAVTAVLVGWAYHLRNLAKAQKNLADMTNLASLSFTEQARVMDEANKQHQEGVDWANKHADAEAGLKDVIDEQIKALRDQTEAEIELAKARGASKQQVTQMELEAEKKELDILKAATEAAEAKHHADMQAVADAQAKLDAFNNGTGENSKASMEAAKKKTEENAAIVEAAIEEKKRRTTEKHWHYGMYGRLEYGTESLTDSDALSFKVGTKPYNQSVAQSRDAFSETKGDAALLESLNKELEDMVKNGQELAGKDLEKYNQKKSERDALQAKYNTDKVFKPLIDAAGPGKEKMTATEWERAGGAIGGHGVSMLDIGKSQLFELKGIHEEAKKANAKHNAYSGSGVDFGR